MNVRIVSNDNILDKIDVVKEILGIDVKDYSSAIGMICDQVIELLEVVEDLHDFNNDLLDLVFSNISRDNLTDNNSGISEKKKSIPIIWDKD